MRREQRRGGKRLSRFLILLGCIGLATIGVPLGAAADPPEAVTIEGPSYFGEAGFGLFQATGLPECGSGTFQTPVNRPSPNGPVDPGYNRHLVRLFTCDGTGHTFVVKAEVRLDFPLGTPADGDGFKRFPTLNWVLVDGDGPFEDLHMNGRGYLAFPLFDNEGNMIGTYDVFEGKAH